MARRKIALIFLLFALLLLILSPWASAPSPSVPAVPKQSGSTAETVEPAAKADPIPLRVAAALDEAEFEWLQNLNQEQVVRLPGVTVELVRVDPGGAYAELRNASRDGKAADVMLLENEWVKAFAVSGYLMPADSAFVGEALSEQFDALSAPLKWNGYLWGVPRDFDPYVLLWNTGVLQSILGENAVPPKNLAQWTELTANIREAGTAGVSWLAMNGDDPLALFCWVQSVSGERSDTLWSASGNPWNATPRGEALALLDRERAGAAWTSDSRETASLLAAGKAAAALLPYSEAQKLMSVRTGAGGGMTMDLSAWKLPYTWPRGRSFAVSSRTGAEEAARRWIAIMTEDWVQQDNWKTFGKLPVYRSLYRGNTALSSVVPVSTGSLFPNQPPADFGPEMPARLARLGSLWREWASGALPAEEWVRRWSETSADFELND